MSDYKYNLILTKGAKEQLNNLQNRTNAASYAEVVRKALALYDMVQEHASNDWEIVLRSKSGDAEKTVVLV